MELKLLGYTKGFSSISIIVFEKNSFVKDQRLKANLKPLKRKLFSFSHSISRSKSQRIIEIRKSIIYRCKGLEKCYSTMRFSKTLTETLQLIKPKNPELNLKHGMTMKSFKH